jgi:hypothetical protein
MGGVAEEHGHLRVLVECLPDGQTRAVGIATGREVGPIFAHQGRNRFFLRDWGFWEIAEDERILGRMPSAEGMLGTVYVEGVNVCVMVAADRLLSRPLASGGGSQRGSDAYSPLY